MRYSKENIIKAIGATLVAVLALPALLAASGQIPAPPQSQPIVITGATIHPISGPAIENGMILFDKGKITAIGATVTIPADALRIDASGKHVYPALIETTSQLGLNEISSVSATRDFAEVGQINPNVRAEVAINPDSEHFPVTRANGVAMAVSWPGGGLIAGTGALLQLDGWTYEDMTMKAPIGMVVDWPRMTVIDTWWMRQSPEEQKKAIAKNIETIEQAFRDARAYKTARAAAAQGGPAHPFDARWQAMLPVLDGEVPVWVQADEIKQIKAAIDWAGREQVRMVLVGGADAGKVTELLKRKNIPVVVRSTLRLPQRRDDDFDAPFSLPRKLHEAGVTFCIAGGWFGHERHLAHHAAKAVSYGLPEEVALKSVTLYAAQIIGVADRIGSLDAGKDATLMISDGSPLELMSNVERLFIQGRDIDLGNRHETLYQKYRQKYIQRELIQPTSSDD